MGPELEPSDEALMRAAQDGDEAAFGQLAERYQKRLLGFAWSRLRSPEAAEDAAQETLLKAWRYRAQYHAGSRVSTWLFAIELNCIRDQWRKAKPESSMEDPAVLYAAERSAHAVKREAPDAEAARREEIERLLAAIDSLGGKTRELLRLRALQDLSLEEAGRVSGLSPAGARAAASRAYAKLRKILKQDKGI